MDIDSSKRVSTFPVYHDEKGNLHMTNSKEKTRDYAEYPTFHVSSEGHPSCTLPGRLVARYE